ncbi:hypothetical protein MIR68_008334 [Amoeboaphelidium protococcarum]|nr:hypothetical protein MIR68_008334 [Amoeboaphelidium protococcarum]
MPRNPSVEQDIKWQDLDKSKYFLYSSAFLASARVAVYPSTVVKTRLQMQLQQNNINPALPQQSIIARLPSSSQNTSLSVVKVILQQQGVTGLFKGMSIMLAGLLPSQALYYSTYEWVRERVETSVQSYVSRETRANAVASTFAYPSSVQEQSGLLRVCLQSRLSQDIISNLAAGSLSSLSSQVVVVPADVVTQRFIHQGSLRTSISSIMRDIYRLKGLSGFYKGSLLSSFTYSSGSAFYWISYAMSKRLLRESTSLDSNATNAVSGAIAGCSSTVLTHPFDLIKTRMQISDSHQTFYQACKQYVQSEGLKHLLTKGLMARLYSSVPVSVIMILSYEKAKEMSLK